MSARDSNADRAGALACDAALFGLDADERRELESSGFPELDQLEIELAAAEVAVHEHEARGARAEALPLDLAARILAARTPAPVERSGPALASSRAKPAAPPRRDAVFVAGWLLAAAAVVIAVIGWRGRAPVAVAPPDAAVETPAGERAALLALPGTSRTPWQATKDAAGVAASGEVIWHAGVQKGVMRFAGLAPNDPARSQYQLWIFDETRDDAQPVDGGVFDVSSSGEVLVPVKAKLLVGKAKLFAVTVERPGGVVVSKRERIVLTATPPPT
ncbi:MAG TPA: anti-sigma factor [Labilithrix sp.]|nr:anti-sigma factor [Labilithrix sp.]